MMRDEVLMELVDRAMNDQEFRRKAQEDPEGPSKSTATSSPARRWPP